jgi:hypothetical protein
MFKQIISSFKNLAVMDKRTQYVPILKKQVPVIVIPLLLMLLLIIAIISNYAQIVYICDSLKSGFINSFSQMGLTSPRINIINEKLPRYINPYRNLPKEFIHIGPFLVYNTPRDISLREIASTAIQFTNYFELREFIADIKKINRLQSDKIFADTTIALPNPLPSRIIDHRNTAKPAIIKTIGLYFTGSSAGSSKFLQRLDEYKNVGINTIVFDVKDVTGYVNYFSGVPHVIEFNTHQHRTIHNIRLLVRELKQRGFHTIARLAIFRDEFLYEKNPAYAIRSKNGGLWNERDKENWCDPTNKDVQDYNISIALELAEYGVDEIQFDYIRFPTTGNPNDARLKYDFGIMPREEVIAQFLKRAYDALSQKNTLISIDIFGVVAWGKEIDINKTGQRIELLAKHCDVISPMLYPSHFEDDFDGFAKPGDNPYYFIFNGCKKIIDLAGKKTIVRPWLQAFKWRVSNYNREYILKQMKATDDSGAVGYLFWNSKNIYNEVLQGLKLAESDLRP